MSIEGLLFVVGFILLVGVVTTTLSARFGVPSLVLFLGVGMLVGREGLGLLTLEDPQLAQIIGFGALVLILFEGGLRTHREDLMSVLLPALSLSTLGVLITVGIVGTAASYLLRVPLELGLLIGAIVGSTDAAAVFSILGNRGIRGRLRRLLEAESGMNDPMAIFLTVLLLQFNLAPGSFQVSSALIYLATQAGVGILGGFLLGELIRRSLRSVRLEASGLYSLVLVAASLLGYGLVSGLGGSGFIAVYLMGVVITDRDLPFRQSILVFQEGFAWLMQIGLFVMLGIFVHPSRLLDLAVVDGLLALILIFLARPVAVILSLPGAGFSLPEKVFLSWAGLRGAVPIILATYPLAGGLPRSQTVFTVVFFVVVVSALIQGWTVPIVGRWLGLLEKRKRPRSTTLELISFGEVEADVLELELPEHTRWAGRTIRELNLPEQSLIGGLLRGDRFLPPRGDTTLAAGDVLFVIVEHAQLKEVRDHLESPEQPLP